MACALNLPYIHTPGRAKAGFLIDACQQAGIRAVLEEFRESRKTCDQLYFEESRRIGKELHEETIEVIQSFKRALDHRLKAIEQLALPVERPVNWARVWVDISRAK